jgi:Predicted transcriptional regulator with C-terminal CBS domains
MQALRTTFARSCRRSRTDLGWTQEQLADAVGLARGYIAMIEGGRANPSLDVVTRIARALDLDVDLVIHPPLIVGGPGQRDAIHARCSGYVDSRLRTAGLGSAREVEIVHARSHGWIDLLAFERRLATLVIVEIKTRLDDLGALERQIGWYERSAISAARRLGWRPTQVVTWLVVLATAENEATIFGNRAIFDLAFPVRATVAAAWLRDGGAPPLGRALALIDPASRRRDWLIRTRLDGRRSGPPYLDYRDAVRRWG